MDVDDDDVPIITVTPDQAKHEGRQWLSTYRHLRTRERAVTAELGPGPGCDALRGKEIADALPSAAASASALQRLQKELWGQVAQARKAVVSISSLLAGAQPSSRRGAAQSVVVDELAAAIDAADVALAAAKDQQCASLEGLYQQQAQLESEIEAIGTRLDAEMEAEALGALALGRGADGPAGTSAPGATARRPVSAARRRAPSNPRARRASTGGNPAESMAGGGGRMESLGRASEGGGLLGAGAGAGGGSLAPEVRAYDDFMAEHGPTGGWDPEDHEEFLAVLKSCGGDYAHTVAIVVERAVGFTRSEIVAHARWHMELCDLEVAKRMALERWRCERQRRRAEVLAEAAALGSDTAEQAQQERRRDQQGQHEEALTAAAKRALVERWRRERAEAEREAAERAAERRAAAVEARRREAETRQAVNKARVALSKEAKERQAREAQRRAAAEAAIRSALAAPTPQQRARVAERSAATFARRQGLLAEAEAAKKERQLVQEALLEKVRVEAPSDPSRLLRGTSAQLQRLAATRAEERQPRDSGFILHSARRTTPGWRAGLAGA
ncbi:hypothetical protein HYH03_005846 [Edaphochlamys debaryana]|uniref:Uncharacterized protein n=1 Tax=Edaphochlamys debaryana TaxID=47281 RepID=A0A835Y5A2_9CHLO|nr:hypothetical protein HYH03_005846 [Edaphochlamys debaryana]|eukprot:KAG2496248.1 hypothetical protein HYH03_005846 [Edaphochlamys debaryana]